MLLAAFLALAAYLYTPAPLDGDAAAYVLQSLVDRPLDRSLHVGVLVPLWLWVGSFGAAAANGFAVVWGLAALVAIEAWAGSCRPAASPRLTIWAPALFLGAAMSWRGALFVEVYLPLTVVALGALIAARRRRDRTAGALLGWMVLMHPGSLALLPGLGFLAGRRLTRTGLGIAVALPLVVWALLWPEPWTGGRGITHLPPFDTSVWQSVQRAWRLLARDLGITALLVALGAVSAWRADRQLLAGLGLVVLGAAIGLDRYSDNDGHLLSLAFVCGLAPGAGRALRIPPRTTWVAFALLLALGIAEATTRHDRVRRETDRIDRAASGRCGEPAVDWASDQRVRLACGDATDRALAGSPP